MNDNKTKPLFIDSDSHIEDHEGIFDYLDKEYAHRKPTVIDIGGLVTHRPTRNKVWLIDGEIRPKLFGYNPSCFATPPTSDFAKQKPISMEVQGLMNTEKYIKGMESMGLDITVIYSTLFLHPLTSDPLFEAALMRSYNSYMAEKCGEHPDRLKWGALIPMGSISHAVSEIKRVKALGATSIMVLPVAGNVFLHEKRFDPIYEEMIKQDLPLCVHVGYGHAGVNQSCDSIAAALILNFEMSMTMGMFSFLAGGILDRFPGLKVAFLEAGAVWLPALVNRLEKWRPTPTAEVWPAKKSAMEYIQEHNLYFTVEGDEDNLVDFINLVGVDRVLGSGDFPHVHYAGGKMAETFIDIKENQNISSADKVKILGKNAQKFYNIR